MPRLKERVNPLIEFKNDNMMKEIHENRLKMFNEIKNMDITERIKLIKEKAGKFRNQSSNKNT